MTTRRQKLHDVLQYAAETGVSTAELLASIRQFTAEGGSGIENFLDETLSKQQATVQNKHALANAKSYLSKALSELDSI